MSEAATDETSAVPAGRDSSELLYACLVTSCSESWQESLHRTKRGAWQAGRAWMLARYEGDHESRRLIGKQEYQFRNVYEGFRVVPVHVRP